MRDIAVFSGSAHPSLAEEICRHLGVDLSPSRLTRFANDCLEVQLQANCRERDVFLIQPLVPPVQEHLVELLLMLDAARGASAARTTVVLPHYAYARSDKKDAPRISIGGRLVADLMVAAGASRVLAMTLHSPQVHGFFSVPVDHLHALRELAAHFSQYDLSNTVVVSPDLGNAKEAAHFARILGLPVAAQVFLCGPQSFMDDVTDGLVACGFTPERVHTERFGARTAITPGITAVGSRPPHPPEGLRGRTRSPAAPTDHPPAGANRHPRRGGSRRRDR